jgi:hypothetical protein
MMGAATMIRFLLPILLLSSNPAIAQTVTCRLSAKFACQAAGCEALETTTWAVIDVAGQTYSRCDRRSCDKYPAQFSRSGAFLIIDVPGRGLTVKVAANMSSFVELVTIATAAVISFGACE